MKKISVLICDDSALMRRNLTKMVESSSGLYVVGTARDGNDAVDRARELKPDVITMDINMPGLDGVSALQIIVEEEIAPVIMVSSLTSEGAQITFECLALGAFDYVSKPGGTVSTQMTSVKNELASKIKAAAGRGMLKKLSRRSAQIRKKSARQTRVSAAKKAQTRAVAIGISTGGPKTIFEVLPLLSPDLNVPVFLVQHMPPTFTNSFARRIDSSCSMRCVEVEAGMSVEPGVIYLGRGGYHMSLHKRANGAVIIRTPTKPVHTFMPSVDVMMDSALGVYGSGLVGVLMTGMGDDGADSMVKIHNAGGTTIAESEESAIVFGMPNEAIERGGAKIVAPSWEIADHIIKDIS